MISGKDFLSHNLISKNSIKQALTITIAIENEKAKSLKFIDIQFERRIDVPTTPSP